MTDALITTLGRLKQITVRPTSAVQRFADDNRDAATVGRALGVDAVLDGHVQKVDDRFRVTVQLVNARDGAPLWTDKFDGQFTNVFALQDSISNRVTDSLRLNLTSEDKAQLAKRYTDNADAYEAYLKGRFFLKKRTTPDLRRSIDYLRQAVDKDPNFALAYSALAEAYSIGDAPLADAVLRRALALDDSLGEAHASLGFYKMFYGWDWATAENEFQRAIELSPGYATAYQWYALYLAARGRMAEAKEMMSKALDLDPLSPNINADLGQIYYFAHEYDQALLYCRKALELDPNFQPAHEYLYYIYAQKGSYGEAVEEFLVLRHGDGPIESAALRQAYAAKGWLGFLRTALRYSASRDSAVYLALFYSQLGDRAQAIEHLEKAYAAEEFFLTYLKVEPAFDALRSHPRFADLLQRMNLE